MTVEVRFLYDEDTEKWEVLVTGVTSAREAQQAFAAVILTCGLVSPNIQHHALVEKTTEGYKLTPAV